MNSLPHITNASLNQVNGNLNTYINHQIAQNKINTPDVKAHALHKIKEITSNIKSGNINSSINPSTPLELKNRLKDLKKAIREEQSHDVISEKLQQVNSQVNLMFGLTAVEVAQQFSMVQASMMQGFSSINMGTTHTAGTVGSIGTVPNNREDTSRLSFERNLDIIRNERRGTDERARTNNMAEQLHQMHLSRLFESAP